MLLRLGSKNRKKIIEVNRTSAQVMTISKANDYQVDCKKNRRYVLFIGKLEECISVFNQVEDEIMGAFFLCEEMIEASEKSKKIILCSNINFQKREVVDKAITDVLDRHNQINVVINIGFYNTSYNSTVFGCNEDVWNNSYGGYFKQIFAWNKSVIEQWNGRNEMNFIVNVLRDSQDEMISLFNETLVGMTEGLALVQAQNAICINSIIWKTGKDIELIEGIKLLALVNTGHILGEVIR